MDLIDTHAHLDFDGLEETIARARELQVSRFVVPAVEPANFERVQALSRHDGVVYTLGIHPMYVQVLEEKVVLAKIKSAVEHCVHHKRFAGIGEIGLDYFVPGLDREKQLRFFQFQLKLAKEFDVPVVMHVRKSADHIARECRRFGIRRGIAHAFNGSEQQAKALIDIGLCLGFGGAMTFTRALQLRRLAVRLPLEALVLETDAPDIAPSWLEKVGVNSPEQLPRIAAVLAELRGLDIDSIARQTSANAMRCLPALGRLT